MRDHFVAGDWNAICTRCGFKHKASQMKLEWNGNRVCMQCYEPRHPSDLIRVKEDEPSTPWARPEPADVFVRAQTDFLLTELAITTFGASPELIYWILTEAGLPLFTES